MVNVNEEHSSYVKANTVLFLDSFLFLTYRGSYLSLSVVYLRAAILVVKVPGIFLSSIRTFLSFGITSRVQLRCVIEKLIFLGA